MLDAEDIIDGIVRGALSGRRKSWTRTGRAVSGSGLVNARTLLAAAGVAWGLFESWQGQHQAGEAQGGSAPGPGGTAAPASPPPPAGPQPRRKLRTRRACPPPSRDCCAS